MSFAPFQNHTAGYLADSTDTLRAMHRGQTHRAPWPDFEAFDRSAYDVELLEAAAVQWAGRAQAEHGSVHQFTQVAHVLCEARAPLHLLGALSRLITDEVRHAELCAAMALACAPELDPARHSAWGFPTPRAPWPRPPLDAGDEGALLGWAAEAILIACCLGETISRPMLEAIATVATDPAPEAVARQILRDEHLHATFGWEALGFLLPRLPDDARPALQEQLRTSLAGFESSTACGFTAADVAGRELTIEAGPANLGTLSGEQYAVIFFATIEGEVLPKMEALGFDASDAWARRHD